MLVFIYQSREVEVKLNLHIYGMQITDTHWPDHNLSVHSRDVQAITRWLCNQIWFAIALTNESASNQGCH